MTTIIGLQHSNGVTLGYDSLCGGDEKYEEEAPKVFAKNGIVYGISGPLTLANVLRHSYLPELPKHKRDWKLDGWVNNVLVSAILSALERRKVLKFEDGKPDLEGAILVVVRGRLYEIDFDTSVSRRTDGQHAIGSGAPYALGALAAGASLREAIEVAASFDVSTGGTISVATADELLNPPIVDYPGREAA